MNECFLYNEKESVVWDSFVENSNNGTLYHLRRFLSYHPPDRFEDHSLLFHKKGKLSALFPACVVDIDSKRTLFSHRGASVAGFVLEESSSFKDAFELTESLIHYAKNNDFDKIVLTPTPLIYLTRLSNNIDFALLQYGFSYLKREISSVLSLKPTLEANLNNFRPEARTAYRRAVKLGVEVKESEDFKGFYKILEANLWARHGVTPTHTVAELKKLKKLFPERIVLLGAYAEDKMIAGVVLFEANPKVIIAFYISHDEKFQKYRAINLLFHDIIKRAIERDFKFLDFGIFTVDMEPNWGLGRFKESFGASGLFRDVFEINL